MTLSVVGAGFGPHDWPSVSKPSRLARSNQEVAGADLAGIDACERDRVRGVRRQGQHENAPPGSGSEVSTVSAPDWVSVKSEKVRPEPRRSILSMPS